MKEHDLFPKPQRRKKRKESWLRKSQKMGGSIFSTSGDRRLAEMARPTANAQEATIRIKNKHCTLQRPKSPIVEGKRLETEGSKRNLVIFELDESNRSTREVRS